MLDLDFLALLDLRQLRENALALRIQLVRVLRLEAFKGAGDGVGLDPGMPILVSILVPISGVPILSVVLLPVLMAILVPTILVSTILVTIMLSSVPSLQARGRTDGRALSTIRVMLVTRVVLVIPISLLVVVTRVVLVMVSITVMPMMLVTRVMPVMLVTRITVLFLLVLLPAVLDLHLQGVVNANPLRLTLLSLLEGQRLGPQGMVPVLLPVLNRVERDQARVTWLLSGRRNASDDISSSLIMRFLCCNTASCSASTA